MVRDALRRMLAPAIVVLAFHRAIAAPAIPLAAAQHAFRERQALCAHDHGRLWGQSLCGPMMFVDPATREAVLNRESPGAIPDHGLYRIRLAETVPLANTALEYGGTRWSMVLWPLPQDPVKRRILLMHESWHRLQPGLGLLGSGGLGTNGHLDTEPGRTWLRAELHALRTALLARGSARRQAIADALRFRAYRRSLWPNAAAQEDGLELNEGMAESTGIDAALPQPAERVAAAVADIDHYEKQPSYVRSFAYATGPAYAELLDAVRPDWRRDVDAHFSFARAVAAAYRISLPAADRKAAELALGRYGGGEIRKEEARRARAIAVREQRYDKEFVRGPTLTFPLVDFSISYDPNAVESFAGHGSVYQTVRIGDVWGRLDVKSGGALVDTRFKAISVPIASAPACGGRLSGAGWSAELKPGFAVEASDGKPGSWKIAAARPGARAQSCAAAGKHRGVSWRSAKPNAK